MRAEKEPLIRKLKTVRGQIDGVIKMMEEDRYCIDISNQLMASASILKNVNRDVLCAHMKGCVLSAMEQRDQEQLEEKISELSSIMEKLSK